MSRHILRDLVGDLRKEVELAHELEDEVRAGLHDLVEEFEREMTEGDHAWVRARERLAAYAIDLQTAHPALTSAADRVIRQLSRMGI